MSLLHTELELEVLPQPDDLTCGPTCLHAVYRYWGLSLPLQSVIDAVQPLPDGGTLAVHLARHALRQGFAASIYTCNLQLFDPSWFRTGTDISAKLREQLQFKHDPKLQMAGAAYLDFLSLGGELRYVELTGRLLASYLSQEVPVLAGLSATYLYDCARERPTTHGTEYDDIRGEPQGHFVVLHGYHDGKGEVTVADPLRDNPGYGSHYYKVEMRRLIAAILLGVLTYDANLLIIKPREGSS